MLRKFKKVMLVGPRSSNDVVSGMRISFDLLIAGFEERQIPHVIIDRSVGMSDKTVGTLTLRSVLANVYLFFVYWFNLLTVQTVYMTIGTSPFGFLRDALMIFPAWILRKRIVLHLKGGGFANFYRDSSPWMQKLMRYIFAKVTIIIVLGNLLVDQFSFVPGIAEKLRVVPNGLPNELQNSLPKSKSLTNKSPIKLLYLSNMIPSKGYMDVLNACRLLNKRNVQISCDFCGAFVRTVNDGQNLDLEVEFHKLVRLYDLEGIVHYHGTVRGRKKEQLLERAHLMLLPTSYPWEGQPISIIEALAFGTPVISTNYRGIPEQIINDYNGYLISPGSPEEIANVVEGLWNNPKKYHVLSQNALNHFQENFTQDAHLNRLIPILTNSL